MGKGQSEPDSSIMLALCDVLNISVNDLLCGEVVTVENYNRELENNLLEMIRQKEQADKHLLALEWVIGIMMVVILLLLVGVASYVQMETGLRVTLIVLGFILFFVGAFFALRIEQVAGYYECGKCGHRYVPTYKTVNLAMHVGRTRYMRCPECGQRSWQKKKLTKE